LNEAPPGRYGLVDTRKEGLWVHYRLAASSDPILSTIRQAVTHAFRHLEAVQKDADRLQKKTGCCLPAAVEMPGCLCCARLQREPLARGRSVHRGIDLAAESSLWIFFNVPGTYVTQGESCLYVVLFVERHHGVIIFYRSGDL
jgi:hypothetical protein